MAKKAPITGMYDSLPTVVRFIIQLFAGAILGGIYRIIRFFETGNFVTLIVGLLTTFTGIGNGIIWIIDLITTALGSGITVCAN